MSQTRKATGGPSQLYLELGFAAFTTLIGAIVVYDSIRAGMSWDASGPQAGFFPFYVGLFIVGGSVVNFARAWIEVPADKLFAEWGHLYSVLQVLVPSLVYVAIIPWLGMYVSSMLLIAGFMKWIGNYSWLKSAAVGFCMPALTFIVFERWFLVPLPKGPIEAIFGIY